MVIVLLCQINSFKIGSIMASNNPKEELYSRKKQQPKEHIPKPEPKKPERKWSNSKKKPVVDSDDSDDDSPIGA